MSILVIDIGSSSVRAVLFYQTAEPGAVARRQHRFNTEEPGQATADPLKLRRLVEECIDEVLPQADMIVGVGMATFVGNVLGVDAAGQPVTPLYTYADTRGSEDVDVLETEIPIHATHQRTGAVLHTAYLPTRLRWLQRTRPQLTAQVARWVDIGTYLYECWLDEAVPCSYSVASWSGLLNRETAQWDAEWLGHLGLNVDALPTLADVSEMRRGLRSEYAARWPLLREAPFALAVGDGAAANVGSGCVDEDHMALTVGSTAALRVVCPEMPPVPRGLWSYRIDKAHHLVGGATSEGGTVYQWVLDTLQLGDLGTLEDRLRERQVGEHGLTFLPLLAGERSPGWAEDAVGAVFGLRLSTTPFDILHAALEGVALRLGLVADQLAPLLNPAVRVIGSGGALSASNAWAQMMASALNRPIHIAAAGEITARGVAILVWWALGKAALTEFPPQIARTLEPEPEAAARLREALERQRDLYLRLFGPPEV